MGTAIVGGVGLAVGLGLLIWGLVERGKRAKAEKEALKLKQDLKDARGKAQDAAGVHKLRMQDATTLLERKKVEVEKLAQIIKELRFKLVQSNDPAAIDAWLDDELNR